MDPTTTDSPRLSKVALFRIIRYEPHPGQLLVHRSRAPRRVLACGTRFGKSTAAAMEIVTGLLEPRPATLAWLVAPTYELTQRVWLRVAGVFQEKLPHRVKAIVPREQRIVVVNLAGGISELRGKGADRPAGLLGEAIDFVVVDEATKLRDDIWPSYLTPRLIDRRGWSLAISTPEGPGWFYEEFRRGQRNRDPDYESWSMPSWTNPHVSRETIEAERSRHSEEMFRSQFGAEFIGVPKEPCLTCGGPREDVSGRITLAPGQHYDDVPRCPSCERFVDSEGRCIVKKYNRTYSSFDIERDDPEWPSVRMYSWHTPDADGTWS
jgi:hypothetical protein